MVTAAVVAHRELFMYKYDMSPCTYIYVHKCICVCIRVYVGDHNRSKRVVPSHASRQRLQTEIIL